MNTLLSDSPVAFITGRGALEGRFDTRFHRPEFGAELRQLTQAPYDLSVLGELVSLSTERWAKPATGTFRYVEINDIDTATANIAHAQELRVEDAPTRAQFLVRAGDLIVSTTRPYRGAVALVPSEYDEAVCSTGFAVIRTVRAALLRSYLLRFLHSRFGLSQMEQRMTGGNYPAITPRELLRVRVLAPPENVQQDIADAMELVLQRRKALRQCAARLMREADECVVSKLGLELPGVMDNGAPRYAVGASLMREGRWDAGYWRPDVRRVLEVITSSPFDKAPLRAVARVNPSRVIGDVQRQELVPYVGLPETDEDTLQITEVPLRPYAEVAGRNLIRQGDILFARIEPSIYNRKYIRVGDLMGNDWAFASTEFHVIEPRLDQVDPDYLYWYLRSGAGYQQIFGKMSGSTGRRRLGRGELESFIVVVPPLTIQRHTGAEAASRFESASTLRERADRQLEEARAALEHALLGAERAWPPPTM